jgi:parvulin-like peptidyl-prolyl isomerase
MRMALRAAMGLAAVAGFVCADDRAAAPVARLLPYGGIVARVNDEIVTSDEIIDRIRVQLQAIAASYGTQEQVLQKSIELYNRTLRMAIEEKAIAQAARAQGIVLATSEVERELNREAMRSGSVDQHIRKLQQVGLTWDQWRRQRETEMLVRELIYRRLGFRPAGKDDKRAPLDSIPTPKEIREYYAEHAEEFAVERRIKPRQVVVGFSDARTKAMARQLCESLRRQILGGADFAEIAKWYSEDRAAQGGAGDWTTREQWSDDAWAALERLPVGAVSPILEIGNSFRIVRIEGTVPPRRRPFSDPEVQSAISDAVQNRKVMASYERVKDEILKAAYVWVRDEEPGAR